MYIKIGEKRNGLPILYCKRGTKEVYIYIYIYIIYLNLKYLFNKGDNRQSELLFSNGNNYSVKKMVPILVQWIVNSNIGKAVNRRGMRSEFEFTPNLEIIEMIKELSCHINITQRPYQDWVSTSTFAFEIGNQSFGSLFMMLIQQFIILFNCRLTTK